MSPRLLPISLLCVSASLAACQDKKPTEPEVLKSQPAVKADPPANQAPAAKAPPSKPVPTVTLKENPLKGVDRAALAKRLKGTWVIKPKMGIVPDVWHLTDDSATLIKGVMDRTSETALHVPAPCRVRFVHRAEGQPGHTTRATFAFDGDTLYAGLGNVGVPLSDKGDLFICTRRGFFVRTAEGACFHLPEEAIGDDGQVDVDQAEPTEQCDLVADQLEARSGPNRVKLKKAGALWLSTSLKGSVAKPLADLAAGKAYVTDLRDEARLRAKHNLTPEEIKRANELIEKKKAREGAAVQPAAAPPAPTRP